MHKVFFSLFVTMLVSSSVLGQSNRLYIGPASSWQGESRTRMIYGPGYEERNSATRLYGYGIRAQLKFAESWGMNAGINYIRRHYEMTVPFNHCAFLEPGQGCTFILAHVDEFGYKTIEIPVGINKYFVAKDRWELYSNLNVVTAFDYASYYGAYVPDTGMFENRELNLFSGSLTGSVGIVANILPGLKVGFEPFIRLVHVQRKDPILLTGYEKPWTYFDNDGGNVLLLIGI
jgi:hypothetical protein